MAEGARSSADSDDIKEIASSIAHDLCNLQWPDQNSDDMNSSWYIHRVHDIVRKVDMFSYEPSVLSIGPYYNNAASLQLMEKQKWRCLDYILKLNCTKRLEDYMLPICNMENQARSCYKGEITLDRRSFQRMLLLDGCFILVYLGGTHGVSLIRKETPGPVIISDANGHWTEHATQQSKQFPKTTAKRKMDTVHRTRDRTRNS